MTYKTQPELRERALRFMERHGIENTGPDEHKRDLACWLGSELYQVQHNGFDEGCTNKDARENYLNLTSGDKHDNDGGFSIRRCGSRNLIARPYCRINS